jgi:3-hydroxybutyryl-CoA dehydrogenase
MSSGCIGVVGAGVMGASLALDLAAHGYRVLLLDLTVELLEAARERITQDFRFVRMMRKDSVPDSAEVVLSMIDFVTDYRRFEEVDVVIENVTERFEIKKDVYAELESACRDDVIFGVNTSCISITRIGSLMRKPENVIGMHFLNPVPLKDLVEVIRGQRTTDETVAATGRFLERLGKKAIVVNDLPGFVTNRILMLTINESAWVVQDGVASPEQVDTIFRRGFGHKMGPLATADLIGLDTVLDSLLVLHESYQDPKFRACPLLRKMVDAGDLGQKSGKGFFKYRARGTH